MENMNLLIYCVIAEGIVCLICIFLIILLKQKYVQCINMLQEQQENIAGTKIICEESENKRIEFQQQLADDLKKQNEESENKRIEFQQQLADDLKKQNEALDEFKLVIRQQMFIHESQLLSEQGQWCLEHDGERKFFKPGKIEKVTSKNTKEESSFEYKQDSIVCTITENGMQKSELIFTLGGAPKSGKIFEKGKLIKSFSYNEMGQVIPTKNEEKK